ncbi:uncharacterized protein LOC110031570 [Phalaenopsis equestris]|uniref:uncharacterized protein LOC110031570 n=1 Tax=Phalaenopsis equestris TaxID=78828 RepID=UPI0009E5DB07|nr:uncharacterized protein LOC110031570 [Phalaenopsis equestris]
MRVAASSLLVARRYSSRPPRTLSTITCPSLSPRPPFSSSTFSSVSSDPAAADAILLWGCTPAEVSTILHSCTSLPLPNIRSVHDKLQILKTLGARGPDLVKIVARSSPPTLPLPSPRFRHRTPPRISPHPFSLRPPLSPPCRHLQPLPSHLRRRLHSPPLHGSLRARLHSSACSIGLQPDAALYKYAVSIIAISRLDTIQSKIANLERFGLSEDEVLSDLFARYPSVLTFSVDKVQRNMTYVLGIMRLPVRAVIEEPKLLSVSLDRCLKPRFLIWQRLQEAGLKPRGKELTVVSAMRMREPQFLKAFVKCHENAAAESLMELYNSSMVSRRLAESSKKKIIRKAFPY